MTSAARHKRKSRRHDLPGPDSLAELRLWEIAWANPARCFPSAEADPMRPGCSLLATAPPARAQGCQAAGCAREGTGRIRATYHS